MAVVPFRGRSRFEAVSVFAFSLSASSSVWEKAKKRATVLLHLEMESDQPTSFVVNSVKRQRHVTTSSAQPSMTLTSADESLSTACCLSTLVLAWAALVLPPFIVTLVLLGKKVESTSSEEAPTKLAIDNVTNNGSSCYESISENEARMH